MATESSQKSIHSIIIDTGPLIKNAISISTIVASAEVLFTTPAILSEIRDAATRSRVETTLMPFLTVRSPSPASYEAVVAFAKKTGDFAVLSRQDLGILALAYEVHCEKHGGPWGLRSAPKGPLTVKPGKEKADEPKSKQKAKRKPRRAKQQPKPEDHEAHSTPSAPEVKAVEQLPTPGEEDQGSHEEAEVEKQIVESQPSPQTLVENQKSTPGPENVEEGLSNLQISESTPSTQDGVTPIPDLSSETDSDEDEDGSWITPSNLAAHQAKDASGAALSTKDRPQTAVATMTTDFAMQNVLLQMNLRLLSTNMQRIRHLRSSILRCHACFFTTKEMDKQFCPRCGQPTLNRVNCSTNAKGEFRVHLAKNYQFNKRGDRYSIPKPVGGTASGKSTGKGGGKGGWGKGLVLAEDQKEYVRQIDEGKRTKARDLMDEDYLPSILTGDRGRAGGRPKVGAGKNVNSKRRF